MKTEPTEAYRMIEEDWYAIPYMGMDYPQDPDIVVDKEDVYEIAKKAFQEGQSSPKIKQLEWVVKELSSDIVECRSKTPIGDYRITHLSSVCLFDLWGSAHSDYSPFVRFGEFDTYEEAQAAAQADFEKRVMGCLE